MGTRGRWIFGVWNLAVIGVLCLTGCVTLRSETSINRNGSGTLRLTMAINRQISALVGEDDVRAFEGVTAALEGSPGAEVRPYLDPMTGQRGIEFIVPFTSLAELGPPPDPGSDEPQPYTVSSTRKGTVTTLNVHMNVPEMLLMVARDGNGYPPVTEQDKGLVSVAEALAGVEISYAIAVSGNILDWGPQIDATYDPVKNELSWHIRPGRRSTISWCGGITPRRRSRSMHPHQLRRRC